MTNLKRNVIVAIAALFVIGIAVPVSAQLTGDVNLSGTVAAVTTITVTPTAAASALDLTASQTDVVIANVTEYSNNKIGYTVTLSSANAVANSNVLSLRTPGVADEVIYTLKYNSVAVALTLGEDEVTNVNVKGNPAAKPLTMSYNLTGVFLSAGTYTDTLTFTIAAK